MKLLHCPLVGLRPLQEFVYGGEVRAMPDPDSVSDVQWAHYIHHRNGAPGIKHEWWYHSPTGTWLIAQRNTLTDEVLTTCLAQEKFAGGQYA